MRPLALPMAVTVLGLAVLCLHGPAARAGEPAMPDPEAVCQQAIRNASAEGGAGEQFCWRANWSMGQFVSGYKAYGDTAWLDAAVKFYDYTISKTSIGPNSYRGWIGPFIYDKTRWCDVHVGDSILVDHMLDFAELVLAEPDLTKIYGEKARAYVQFARKNVIEKWDSRGTWHEDGPFGAYVSWDTYCEPGKLDTWTKAGPDDKSGLSLPFNKQNDMALVCLKLYRITGQRFYRDKARKIFTFLRSRMQYVADKDYYTWNYWDPFGPWDLNVEEGSARHWMNVHGYRNYQAGEVRQLVEAYHSGIVFTEKDIQRIINTNLKVMWNGDKAAPKYVNSNAELPVPPMTEEERKAREAEIAANPLSKEGRAGTLWTGLLDFDPTIRELYAAGLGGGNARAQIAAAHYNNVTAKRPAGFDRHHAAAVDVPQWPVSDCRSLTVAAVMPATVKRGVPSYVFCKARVPVELEVGLYDADGKQLGSPMYKGKVEGGTDGHAGVFFFEWRPQETLNRPLKGAYIVRWTVPDGHRDFPVTIQ